MLDLVPMWKSRTSSEHGYACGSVSPPLVRQGSLTLFHIHNVADSTRPIDVVHTAIFGGWDAHAEAWHVFPPLKANNPQCYGSSHENEVSAATSHQSSRRIL